MTKQEMIMSAISNMLFGQSGIDVSGIVADMCPEQDKEATTTRCAIALALNGKTAPIPKAIRYDYGWRYYYTVKVIQASLIKGEYWVEKTRYEKDGEEWKPMSDVQHEWMSPTTFEDFDEKFDETLVRGMAK